MTNFKPFYAVVAIVMGLLIIISAWNLYENSKPMKIEIDEAIAEYDDQYNRTIAIYFHDDKPYVFYEKSNKILKVVLLGSSALEKITVKEVVGEIPMIQYDDDKDVTWSGLNATGGTNYLYGVIFDPEISQIILESEDDQVVNIARVDESRSIWFGFLDEGISSPITIRATDKMGNEKYYHGPHRGN